MKIQSAAFADGSDLPQRYTCDGSDISPPLNWAEIPDGTKSFVLIVDDPDAPDPLAPRRTWVHWVLFNIPADVDHLDEGATRLPPGTQMGVNDWNRTVYGGACPPIGRHRYFHKLYALDTKLEIRGHPSKAELVHAMKGHILAEAELMGTYKKSK